MFVVFKKINFSIMKKLSLVIAFLIALGNITFAQKSKKGAAPEIDVPTPVLKTFNTKYKLATKTKWAQEEDNYRVDFKYNDINMAAAYSSDGKLLYTEKEMAKAQYNKTALKYISENYAGYKISYMRKRDTYDKKTTYIAMLKKTKEMLEVEFDKKGGFIRDADKTPVTASKKKVKKEEDEETTTDEEEKPAKKDTKAKKSKDSEDNEDEEATPPPAKKETKAAPKKSNDDEDEEATPPPAKKETKAAPKKSNDDEDEEATPPPAKKETKAAPKKSTSKDEDDEDEEATPAPKKEKAKPAPKPKKKTSDDDEDDE